MLAYIPYMDPMGNVFGKQMPHVAISILIPFLHRFHHRFDHWVRFFRLAFPTFFPESLVGIVTIVITIASFRFRTWAGGRWCGC